VILIVKTDRAISALDAENPGMAESVADPLRRTIREACDQFSATNADPS
jgi:hypothetical protein